MKKRTIVLLIFVVLVIGGGALFMSALSDQEEHSSTDGSDSDDGKTYDARIAWKYTLTDAVYSGGFTEYPDAGKQFIVIEFIVANDRVSRGIDLGSGDDIDWTVTYNGINYTDPSSELYSLPGFQNITVSKGYAGTDVWMTEIPDSAGHDDVKISAKSFLSLFSLKYDSTLLAELPPVDFEPPTARIAWTTTLDTTNPGSALYDTPSEGMQFLTIHFILANDDYAEGIKLGPYDDLTWTIAYDGVQTSSEVSTYNHPETRDVTVMPGGQDTGVALFEIPKGKSAEDIQITVTDWLDRFIIEYDASLNTDLPPTA